jgi:uncharacterized membrane protein
MFFPSAKNMNNTVRSKSDLLFKTCLLTVGIIILSLFFALVVWLPLQLFIPGTVKYLWLFVVLLLLNSWDWYKEFALLLSRYKLSKKAEAQETDHLSSANEK